MLVATIGFICGSNPVFAYEGVKLPIGEPSPLHFRPKVGSFGDVIPFYWKGQYHVLYIRAGWAKLPWDHIVSSDLVHWYELPTAIVPDGTNDSPDGQDIGTGSEIEHNGLFDIFYTAANPRNKLGIQCVSHATSTDLVTWARHPGDAFYADGINYKNDSFRDSYAFWNDEVKKFWIVVCAIDPKTGAPVQGLVESPDLATWKQVPPLVLDPVPDGNAECPEIFRFNNAGPWYLINSVYHPATKTGATLVRFASDSHGPYRFTPSPEIDTTILYAAKSMFDGKRRVITGWIRDLGGQRDDGEPQFGGDQCILREMRPGADGQIYFKPVPEALAQFGHVIFNVEGARKWPIIIRTPDDYLLDCLIQLKPGADLTVAMRSEIRDGSGYRLVIHPATQEVEIAGTDFSYKRNVKIDFTQPVKIQAFVLGTIIECYVNDEYVFSCRAYEHRSGGVKFSGGKVLRATVKTLSSP